MPAFVSAARERRKGGMPRKYPRSTLKKILRAHNPDKRVTNDVDLLVYLDLVLFIERLAKKAVEEAKENDETMIMPRHIQEKLPEVLKEFRG